MCGRQVVEDGQVDGLGGEPLELRGELQVADRIGLRVEGLEPGPAQHLAVHQGGLAGTAAGGQPVRGIGGRVHQPDQIEDLLGPQVGGHQVDHVEPVAGGEGAGPPSRRVIEANPGSGDEHVIGVEITVEVEVAGVDGRGLGNGTGGGHLAQRLHPPPQAQAVEDRGHGHDHPQPAEAAPGAQAPDQSVAQTSDRPCGHAGSFTLSRRPTASAAAPAPPA